MALAKLYRPQPGEKLLMVLRPHPITFVPSVVIFLFASVVPAVAAWVVLGGQLDIANIPSLSNPLLAAAAVLVAGTYYLCLWLFFFTQFVTFYLDVSIVTDRRIVEAEQSGLFSRTVSELDLARVQDVTSAVHGFIPTIFNYGDVSIQTAGEQEHFTFERIHDPHTVRERILDLSHSNRKTEAQEIMGETIRQENI